MVASTQWCLVFCDLQRVPGHRLKHSGRVHTKIPGIMGSNPARCWAKKWLSVKSMRQKLLEKKWLSAKCLLEWWQQDLPVGRLCRLTDDVGKLVSGKLTVSAKRLSVKWPDGVSFILHPKNLIKMKIFFEKKEIFYFSTNEKTFQSLAGFWF